MKKSKLLYTVCLLIPCLLLSNGFAQEYAAQWHLPEGAKARLGKGSINDAEFSPDGTRLAIASDIGIWIYDAHTGTELARWKNTRKWRYWRENHVIAL